jgi:hypothetical protein
MEDNSIDFKTPPASQAVNPQMMANSSAMWAESPEKQVDVEAKMPS